LLTKSILLALTLLTWNGMNSSGHSLASGIYVYRLESSTGFRETKQMNLLR